MTLAGQKRPPTETVFAPVIAIRSFCLNGGFLGAIA
jgi:hypothetical protein